MLTFMVILMLNLMFSTAADINAELKKKDADNSLIVDSREDCEFRCYGITCLGLGSVLPIRPCKPKPTIPPHCQNRHGVIYCKTADQNECVAENSFCSEGVTCCGNLPCVKLNFPMVTTGICKATNSN